MRTKGNRKAKRQREDTLVNSLARTVDKHVEINAAAPPKKFSGA
jgi:hypothetical protein